MALGARCHGLHGKALACHQEDQHATARDHQEGRRPAEEVREEAGQCRAGGNAEGHAEHHLAHGTGLSLRGDHLRDQGEGGRDDDCRGDAPITRRTTAISRVGAMTMARVSTAKRTRASSSSFLRCMRSVQNFVEEHFEICFQHQAVAWKIAKQARACPWVQAAIHEQGIGEAIGLAWQLFLHSVSDGGDRSGRVTGQYLHRAAEVDDEFAGTGRDRQPVSSRRTSSPGSSERRMVTQPESLCTFSPRPGRGCGNG